MIRKIPYYGSTVVWDASGKTSCWVLKQLSPSAMICLQALFISCSCGQKQVFFLFWHSSGCIIALSTGHRMLEKQSCFLDEKGKWARKPDCWRRKGAGSCGLRFMHFWISKQEGLMALDCTGQVNTWEYQLWVERRADDGSLKRVTLAFRSNHVQVCWLN